MIKYYKGQHIIHLTDAVIEQQRKQAAKQRILVDPTRLKWKPYVPSSLMTIHKNKIKNKNARLTYRPVFSRAQLAFGF